VVNEGGPHLYNQKAVNSYSDKTDLGIIDLKRDSVYSYLFYHIMPGGKHSDARVTVFMDFNNNQQYDIPQERVISGITTAGGFVLTGQIQIPNTVITNVPTGMRVIFNNNIGPNVPSDEACGPYTSGETEDFVVRFVAPVPASVGSVANLGELKVFPNPTEGLTTITFNNEKPVKDLTLTVSNVTGQRVMQQSYQHVGAQFSTELNLSNQAKGVYFVEIRADGQRMIRQLVVR
jgi:hypothetical protein